MNWLKIIKFISIEFIGIVLYLFPILTEAQHLLTLDSNIIQLSSTLWSDLRDIKFHDSKALCVFFDGLTIADLSDINSPLQIGQVELPKNSHKVDVSGNYAYVIAKDSSLYIIDISSLNQPILINSFKTPDIPMDIEVRNNCAYVAARNAGLLVLDVYDPFNVSLIGSCGIASFSAVSLYLHGNLAYLAGTEGLKIINIFSPYFPLLFGSSDVMTGARKIFVNVDSGRTYTYLSNPDELWILDVTNPKDIFPLSSYTSPSTIADISVSGDYAYLGLNYESLRILDTKDKTSPQMISALRLGNETKGVFSFRMNLQDESYSDFVFVTDQFDPIRIINVFNPDRPFVSGRWIIPGSRKDVAVSVVDRSTSGMNHTVHTTGGKENYAYVLCENSGLHILNVTDPNHPQIVSTLFAPYNNNSIDIEGDYAYITALLVGMQVVNITDPFHPAVVEKYQPQGYTYGVKVEEGYAYLLNAENDIQIIDVRNPLNLIPQGFIETPGNAQEIAIRGDYLYVADLSAGLTIINVADKDNLFLVRSVPTVGRCKKVFSLDTLLFLACENVGIEMYDFTNPEAPLFLGLYSTTDEIKDLYVETNYAYLTMENHKIEVIDICSPSSPLLVASYSLLDNPGNLMVKDNYIYLCDGRSFKILQFLPPVGLLRPHPKF